MRDRSDARAAELFGLVEELYPFCRSLTGDGVRETLAVIGRFAPLEVHEVPSRTSVLDWTVPDEWNIRDAYIADSSGRRLVDFRAHNLHVVSYSTPVHETMSLGALRPHLHTLPERPDAIPYRTSYYERTWGFCLSQRQLDALPDGEYEVCIDASLEPGVLRYGEALVRGALDDEILISAHICHPSLADDNLSSVAVSSFLARDLSRGPRPRHTYRFLYAPGTIGAISWLARNGDVIPRVRHGLTLTCLGDSHPFTYKRTVFGAAEIDQAASYVLLRSDPPGAVIDFFPYGYDERQYNAPGFRLAVGSLMRGRHGQFPEYHTSDDNLDFVTGESLAESLELLATVLGVVDRNRVLRNVEPFGEPQLGRRGLYGALGGTNIADAQLTMLWILNLSDGGHTLLDIAERAGVDFESVVATAEVLEQHGLLETV
jgi:aminopeptidase-like protein